jgi:hypothetical protein
VAQLHDALGNETMAYRPQWYRSRHARDWCAARIISARNT